MTAMMAARSNAGGASAPASRGPLVSAEASLGGPPSSRLPPPEPPVPDVPPEPDEPPVDEVLVDVVLVVVVELVVVLEPPPVPALLPPMPVDVGPVLGLGSAWSPQPK
jgi:hypothetical protein